jgi:hypothetical protein
MNEIKTTKGSYLNILLFTIVFLLIGIRIFQLRFIPYGSPDDNGLAALSYIHGSLWEGALNQAKSQGRFYQIPFAFMTQLPYLILEHQFLWFVIAIQVIIFNIGLYLAFLSIIPTKVYALFSLFAFNSLFDFRWGYNSINAFPFWFCFSLTCFLFSIRFIYLSNTYASQRSRAFFRYFAIFLCFIAAMGYESLLYFPFLLVLVDFIFWRNFYRPVTIPNEFFSYIRYRKGTCISVITFFAFYSSAYLIFRNQNPSDYSGVKFSFSEPQQTISTIFRMSLSGFNSPYYLAKIDLATLVFGNFFTLIIFALIYSAFCYRIIAQNNFQKFSRTSFLIGCVLVFVPNILYGFTQRYRDLAQVNPLYLGALFSAPAIVYLFLIGVSYFLRTHKSVRIILIIIMSLFFSLFSNINNQNITKYGDEMRLRNPTWKLVDCLISLEPSVSTYRKVLAPDLDIAIGTPSTYKYWDYYFSKKLNVRVEFVNSVQTNNLFANIEIEEFLNHRDLKYFTFNRNGSNSVLRVHLSYDKETEIITRLGHESKNTQVPTRC